MSKHDIIRCKAYIVEMGMSSNNQGYVIGNVETGVTVKGKLSIYLCTEDEGLREDFFVSGFTKERAEEIIKKYTHNGLSVFYKIDWYKKRMAHLMLIHKVTEEPIYISPSFEMDTQFLRDLDDMYEKYGGHGA
jgi:hypothetical protein